MASSRSAGRARRNRVDTSRFGSPEVAHLGLAFGECLRDGVPSRYSNSVAPHPHEKGEKRKSIGSWVIMMLP